jgi:hypothetical protein
VNSDFPAGVKKRIFRSASRTSVGTSVLSRMLRRFLHVARCRRTVARSWPLRAVSYLLSDCKSSFNIFQLLVRTLEFLVDVRPATANDAHGINLQIAAHPARRREVPRARERLWRQGILSRTLHGQ